MLRFFSTFPPLNKLPIFSRLKSNIPIMQHVLKITSLKLNQQPLPKQPVPDLEKTAERYLKTLKPLLNEEEYCNTDKVVRKFISEDGLGPSLHKKLQERYEKTENWMGVWWLKAAYLGYRMPVIVHSSPGTVAPRQGFKSAEEMYTFAARLVEAVCNYNAMVKSGKMKQEMVRKDPLDMLPYGMILGTHRQPDRGLDKLLHTDHAKHIVIICNNHFFKLNIVDGSGKSLNENQLKATIKDIAKRSCTAENAVGILTGDSRDTWAENHAILKDIGSNSNVLKDLESSLFVLCLDKELPKDAFKSKNYASVRSVQTMTGFSSCTNAGNRWHDKTVQYIVSPGGYCGMEYEHSPCEGVPVAVLHDFVLNQVARKSETKCEDTTNFPKAEELKFILNDKLEEAIKEAARGVDKLSENIDMECFTFEDFGTDEIKKCKLSPDSFIQIAMQVTFYKLQKKPPAHYESAALRRFISARTECIRSTSTESVAFAKLMISDCGSDSEKKEALTKAINAHKQSAGEAAAGEGIDRLFFGLKMIAIDEKIELPAFYKDVGWTRSTHFTLTSSQVPFKTASFMCYGPVVPEGYGCCYNPRPKDILFACSSFQDCPETSSKAFAETLRENLCNMKKVAEQ